MPRTRLNFNENTNGSKNLSNEKQLLEVLDDFLSDVKGGSRGRGGGITHIDDAVIFLDEEVVHQSTCFGNSLGTDTGRCGGEMIRLDRWYQSLQGFHKSLLGKGTPHLTPSHLPVLHRHDLEAGVGDRFNKVFR